MKVVVALRMMFTAYSAWLWLAGCSNPDFVDTETESVASAVSKNIQRDDLGIPLTIYGSKHRGAQTLNEEQIVDTIRTQFQPDLEGSALRGIDVRVVYGDDDQPSYLVVYLKHRDTYLLEVAKVTLANYRTVSVTRNYEQQEIDLVQAATYQERATCPDNSIDAVFATCLPDIESALAGVNTAATNAQNAGWKVKKLIGTEATTTAYKNWLACSNLKVLGNIGHGSPQGIGLADGTLSSNDFNSMSAGALTPKILYFNSCQVHNNPLEPAILKAGASRFIGGNINLWIGSSEEVFKCFWEEAIRTKPDNVEALLKKCETNTNYPDADAHGITGTGPLPWNSGALGDTCTSQTQCDSGFCANGVCCRTACTDACHQCDATGTCGASQDGDSCADNDKCNGEETCQAGVCKPGIPIVCSNNNVCDGLETCQNGTCVKGTSLRCDDGNPCTTDSCDSKNGCQNQSVTNGTSCTGGQCGQANCQNGTCTPSDPDFCDDGDPCTKNTCDFTKGCQKEQEPDGFVCGNCQMCTAGNCVQNTNCNETFEGKSDLLEGIFGCQTSGNPGIAGELWLFGISLLLMARVRNRYRF